MAIERAVELLREDLKRVLQGSGEFDQIGVTIKNAKTEVVKRYGSVFAPSQIPLISAEEFRGFLLFKNNQHWDSLHRQGPQMTADMEQLRRALTILVDESKPVRQRLDQLRPANRDAMVKGLGRATITAILQIVDADHYGIVNNIAELGMKALGIWPTFPYKATFGERYEAINAVLLKIASLVPTDLWTLDMLWWHMQPHVPTGSSIETTTESDEQQKSIIAPPATEAGAFALESHLQEFLIENWSQTLLGTDWDLLENDDGDLIGAYYDTKEVGEIDLLAKHKNKDRWLVIELKRNQTSDTTVGQLLRYRSWVRENLAKPGETVEALIICPEADLKLKYAIKGLPDVTCLTYRVRFVLTPAELSQVKSDSTTA